MSSVPSAHETEPELMARVQADDTEAFGMLYDRLASRALRVAHAVGVDRDRAEDAVQEAFLSIWRGRCGYRSDRGDVHTWALGIVRNRAIDSLRRNGRHDRARDGREDLAAELPALGLVADDTADRDEASRLRALLAALPLAQREVIALAYFGELTHSEIAQELALPLGTVKGRMRLGLEKLRSQIAA